MAFAMTQQQQHRRHTILKLVVLLLASAAAMPAAAAAAACDSEMLPAGRMYATCIDLPTLGATLHWTYDEMASSLSLAFAAKPATTAGWVAWGINPIHRGMNGAQTLLAFKQNGSYVVNTYNLTLIVDDNPLGAVSTPILYNPTELAADEGADGKVRIYGKLQLPKGFVTVNHLWNVGSVLINGGPAEHALAPQNKQARGSLALAGAPAPAPALPSGKPSSPSAAATSYASAPVLAVLLALAGFMATV